MGSIAENSTDTSAVLLIRCVQVVPVALFRTTIQNDTAPGVGVGVPVGVTAGVGVAPVEVGIGVG